MSLIRLSPPLSPVDAAELRALTSTPVDPPLAELGDSGTARRGGWITGYERNPRLRPFSTWAYQADEMIATDPKLAQCEDTLRRTLLTAEWRFEPGPAAIYGSPAERDTALRWADRFNRWWGFDGGAAWQSDTWEAQLSKLLRFVAVGARYAEEIYGIRDGFVFLRSYADREPTAHSRWIWSDDGTQLAGVEQIPPTPFMRTPTFDNRKFFIPASKLLLLTFGGTGQNLEGRGALRACWQWYSLSQHLLDLLAIAAERWAVPTPIIKVNRQAAQDAGYTPKQIDDAVGSAQTSARRYVAGEEAWLQSIVGVEFDTYGQGNFDPAGLIEAYKQADRMKANAWGLAYLDMGSNDVGSRAVGQLLQEQAVLAAVNILDIVAGQINGSARPGGGTVGRLMGWNDPEATPATYPVLTHRGIKVDRLSQLLPHLANLVNVGALTVDDAVETGIRDLAGLPRLPTERTTEQRVADRTATPPAMDAATKGPGLPGGGVAAKPVEPVEVPGG